MPRWSLFAASFRSNRLSLWFISLREWLFRVWLLPARVPELEAVKTRTDQVENDKSGDRSFFLSSPSQPDFEVKSLNTKEIYSC